ncbi:788_t:CDS:2 [Entrophospora sp. SA101]|nr:788_t:CDS:2 [Entrophospora sp. SA101]
MLSFREQINSKIHYLEKTNYELEKDQASLSQEVEKIVEIPINSVEQAILYLGQLRMNCLLTKED